MTILIKRRLKLAQDEGRIGAVLKKDGRRNMKTCTEASDMIF